MKIGVLVLLISCGVSSPYNHVWDVRASTTTITIICEGFTDRTTSSEDVAGSYFLIYCSDGKVLEISVAELFISDSKLELIIDGLDDIVCTKIQTNDVRSFVDCSTDTWNIALTLVPGSGGSPKPISK